VKRFVEPARHAEVPAGRPAAGWLVPLTDSDAAELISLVRAAPLLSGPQTPPTLAR
jgi:hypothetical protein